VIEVFRAQLQPKTSVDLNTPTASYNFVTFGKAPETLAVYSLYGCTAIVVISRKGAWMGHFWERPGFKEAGKEEDPDFAKFDAQVVDVIDTGLPGGPRKQYVNQYAVGELRNKDDKGDLGHMFDDVNDPHVFVIYPRPRIYTGKGQFDTSPNAGHGRQAFPEANKRVVGKLQHMFPNIPKQNCHTKSYSPMVGDDKADLYWNTPRGKVLVQYMPAPAPCPGGTAQGKAKWRIFVENGKLCEWLGTLKAARDCTNGIICVSRKHA
jgi:hypothetical protein